MKAKFVNEILSYNLLDRRNKALIDINDADYVYHWLTEGKFFEACYGEISNDDKFILKRGVMPEKPSPKYKLGYENDSFSLCLTLDPKYMSPAFNEDGSCIIMDMHRLKRDYDFIDLTNNGEAEIRTRKPILNWPKYVTEINILEKGYLRGNSFEEFKFRAISEWFPDELKPFVKTFKNEEALKTKRTIELNKRVLQFYKNK